MIVSSYNVGTIFPAHTLYAHNDAAASANKIHDDTVAKQYGFRGGLVPGVSVYAYMTYPLVDNFAQEWLSRGTAQVRFTKPIYEGDHVTVTSTEKFAKKGHDFVALGVLLVAGGMAVQRVTHRCIFRPRQQRP